MSIVELEQDGNEFRLVNPDDLPIKLREMITQNNVRHVSDDFTAGIISGRIEAFSYVLELLGEEE
jgi:hypothetical protein